MQSLTDILPEIEKLQAQKLRVIIGIDGRSGSGKSSFAEKLHKLLPESKITHLDDFDLYQGASSIQKVVKEVLKPAKEATEAQILIVKGVFALSAALEPYYDYMIWVDCPKDIGFTRGLQRDINLNGTDNSQKWQNFWLPKEEDYIEAENPQAKADALIDGTL